MNIPMPTAAAETEEPVRRTPAQRAADWRARREEEAAALKRRAALDAAIVDALLVEMAERDDGNRRAGIEGPAKVGMREVMAAVIRRNAPAIPREETIRQLHARLAPGRPNPYDAASRAN